MKPSISKGSIAYWWFARLLWRWHATCAPTSCRPCCSAGRVAVKCEFNWIVVCSHVCSCACMCVCVLCPGRSIVAVIQRIFGGVIALQFAYCLISLSLCVFLVSYVRISIFYIRWLKRRRLCCVPSHAPARGALEIEVEFIALWFRSRASPKAQWCWSYRAAFCPRCSCTAGWVRCSSPKYVRETGAFAELGHTILGACITGYRCLIGPVIRLYYTTGGNSNVHYEMLLWSSLTQMWRVLW